MKPVGLGMRAQRDGAVVVGVAIEGGVPRVVLSTFLATSSADERTSLEPEGRKRQNHLASKGLRAIVASLGESGYAPALAALLVNRAGWVTDLAAYSAAYPEHVPVAQGLAVREALRFASGKCGLEIVEVDEKSLKLDPHVSALGATVGKPWRKEQKLATQSAWFAMLGQAQRLTPTPCT